jgi:multiple sugar transport system permease protein
MWSWNEFFWPLVITNGEKMKVVTVGLQSYKNDYFIQYNLLTAASILSIIPMIVMFSIFQKGIIQSAAMSGLKG